MMSLKFFGSICILAFGLLASVSAQNISSNATTTAAATTAAAAATTAAILPTPTTAAAAPTTAAAAPTAAAPTTAPNNDVTENQSRIEAKMRITSEDYDEVQNLSHGERLKLKEKIEKEAEAVLKAINELVINVTVTAFKNGSVIVEYYVVLNTASEAEAAKIANAINEVIESGQIGNYTLDKTYKPEAYIIRKVKASEVSTAPVPTTTTVSTTLLIILGVALFILLVIIIILVVLVFCLMKIKKNERKQ